MKQRGVTLIEVLIYIALFTMLVTGAVVSAYNLFESSDRDQTKAMVQEEGDFLLGKIEWAISGAQSVNNPPLNSSSLTLSVNKWDTSIGNPVQVTLAYDDLSFIRGTSTPVVLNNTNVAVRNVLFSHTYSAGQGINAESIITRFTLEALTPNGAVVSEDFTSTDYLRK